MGVDYYHILKVNRSASKEELRRAYRKLAMLWHPDKHQGDKQTAEARFKEISEAYEVLSDIEKRAIYDEYGEEGLKGIPASASRSTTSYSAPSRGHFNFQFNPRNAEDIFAEAFRNEADSEYMSHSKSTKVQTESSRRSQCQNAKAPAIERKLACSLEELFNGCTRKIKISRNVLKSNGQYVSHSEILSIDIKPGWKKGTKITFPRMGNEEPNMIPADIVFILDEKPHDIYTRAHNDLIVCLKISLGEALGGTTINLQTLDCRTLPIQLTDIVTPGHELVVPHEGMPIGRVPGSKGNLKIKFDVVFPTNLTEEQRDGIKAILGC